MRTVKAWIKPLAGPAAVGLLAGLLGYLGALALPNRYVSQARILPAETKPLSSVFGQLATAASLVGLGLPGDDAGEANFTEILKSRWMAEQLLAGHYTFVTRPGFPRPDRAYDVRLADYLRAKTPEDALRRFQSLFSATRDVKTKVLTVSASTASPELSRQLVARSLELLEQFVHQKGRSRSGRKAEFAAARLQEARLDMDRAGASLRRFEDVNRNSLSTPDPGVRLTSLTLGAEWKLRCQIVSTLALNLEQALLDEKNDLPILNVMDPPSLPQERGGPPRGRIAAACLVLAAGAALAWKGRRHLKQFTSTEA